MKLMSMKQYMKMTRVALLKKIMKALKKLPKMKLAKVCYDLEKSMLPTISKTITKPRTITRLMETGQIKKSVRKKKLKAGIHNVIVAGTKRKVRVLANGQWRFMKE